MSRTPSHCLPTARPSPHRSAASSHTKPFAPALAPLLRSPDHPQAQQRKLKFLLVAPCPSRGDEGVTAGHRGALCLMRFTEEDLPRQFWGHVPG